MELLYEKLDEDIVQRNANDHQQEIPQQLHPSPERGAWKHDITVQVEAGGETDGKSDQEGRDIRTDGAQRRISDLFGQNEIIADKVDEDVQYGVGAATYCIPKSLQRHELPEWRIKKVDSRCNAFLKHFNRAVSLFSKGSANVAQKRQESNGGPRPGLITVNIINPLNLIA